MIVEKLYISESSSPMESIPDYDLEVMKSLVEQYGIESIINQMNDDNIKSLNEGHSYYGSSGGNYDRTGGSRVSGISGALQSLPSFLITTAICWPVSLLAAIGALSYRIQKNYQDKESWLNRLNPRFWVDYIATPSRDKCSSSSGGWNGNSSHKKDSSTFWEKTKSYLGIGGATAAGAATGTAAGAAIAAKKDGEDDDEYKEMTPEEIKSKDFKEYWFTLSNKEILRVRADSEEHAVMFVNMIIAYTKKTYDELNKKITMKGADCPRYTFYFNDGEMCYWTGPTKEQAYKEALKTRKELTDTFNRPYGGIVHMDDLSTPEIEGDVEISRTDKIPVPEQDKFLDISTTQPRRVDDAPKNLPKPVYRYEDLDQYRLHYANFYFNVPSSRESEAVEMIRELNHNNALIDKIYNNMVKRLDMYIVVMADGDRYYIPGDFPEDVKETAKALWKQKIAVIEHTLQSSYKEQFTRFFDVYHKLLTVIKKVEKTKAYNIQKGDEGHVVLVTTGEEPSEKGNTFKL